MENKPKMKMVFAVLQGDDYEQVVRALNKNGFYLTLLNSVGGFLKKRSVTIMMAVEETRMDQLLEILRVEAGERTETVYETPTVTGGPMMGIPPAIPMDVNCGGVAIFVLDLDGMIRF